MAVENVPLAIVGIGCLFPRADGHRAYWANIKHGEDAVGPVPETHWKPGEYFDADPKAPDMTYAVRGAFLDAYDFNPLEFGISPVDLEATDTSQLLGLVAARKALTDAGYGPDRKYDKNRVSVILGVTGTLELVIPLGARLGHPKWRKALADAGIDQATTDQIVADIADSYVPWQENSFPGLLGNVVAGRIANKLDLGGTNCVVDAACASSLAAVHLACLELASGKCDVALTGGVDTFNDIFMYMCFSKTPALSKTGDAKPFDANGDGTILGEGLGMVVLKRLEDAERDKDRIYAVIRAIGTSSDGKGNAVYAPSAEGQVRCLRSAYRQAEVSPATIELVEAHGTGTKVGDTVEATALAEVFNQTRRSGTWCAVGSVKSMIGHTKAAAGAAGLIKAALALHHKVLPPTLKVRQPVDPLQPGKSPLYVNLEKRPWLPRAEHPRRAALSAFGFGGSNFHAILEEHSAKKKAADWDGRSQILAFSANTPGELEALARTIPAGTHWGDFCRFAAGDRERFRTTDRHRLTLVIQQGEDLAGRIETALARLKAEPGVAWSLPEGAWHGIGEAVGDLGVLFPGQGSQHTGMLREMACVFPEMLDALALADKGREYSERLAEAIYPHSAFTPEQKSAQDTRLRATEYAQPAIGAVSVGAWETLKSFGVRADAFAGHSYGELTALWAAGVYDAESLHKISRERGRLMAAMASSNAGGMLAVLAPLADIEKMLRETGIALVFANRNSPAQGVLSGTTAEIARAEVACQQRNLRHTRLPVSAAFHSSLVASASKPFRESLESVRMTPPQFPVPSNRDGREYSVAESAIRDQLAAQLAEPVDFVRQVEEMHRRGIRTFLEVGPGQVLTKLAAASLKHDARTDCFAIDASGGRKPGLNDLAVALARLAARGHSVNLAAWEAGQSYPVSNARPGLTVPICGANYVRPKPPKPKSKPVVVVKAPSPARPVSEPITLTGPKPPMSQAEPNRSHDPASLQSAFGVAQQSLHAFQRMQEETARLHKQFLDNQQAALATLQALVGQQQALAGGHVMPMPAFAPVTYAPPAPQAIAAPAPVYVPPPVPVQPVAAPPAPVPVAAPVAAQAPVAAPVVVAAKPAPVAKKSGPDAGQVLLAVVAEKTGYPAEMLGLDMQLDADLGIDSIKRVEILSALQEKLPDAPSVKPEHLGTLHTLRDIVTFLGAGAESEPITAAPASATPVAASTAPAAPASGGTAVGDVLLSVVAEKTGYPAEMLGLDMQLDADLGIDSIKRVEILSALQEKLPDAPSVKPEHLGTLHTLRDIASLLAGPLPAAAGPPIIPVQESPLPFAEAITPASAESDREISPELPFTPIPELPPTAYQSNSRIDIIPAAGRVVDSAPPSVFLPPVDPPPMPMRAGAEPVTECGLESRLIRSLVRMIPLDPSLPRERITTDRFAPVWLIAEPSSMTVSISRQFETAGCKPQFIPWNESPFAYEPKGLAGLVLIAPEGTCPDDLPVRAFRWLRRAAGALNESARHGGSFFVTVTRLDGQFGFGELTTDRDPVQGSLAGLSKTAFHEWPAVRCKAIDVEPAHARNLISGLVDEILLAGPLEVGLTTRGRFTTQLVDEPLDSAPVASPALATGAVVVVSGGARGVTAESLFPLIHSTKPRLVILGRTPLSENEPDWLAPLSDEAEIKKALLSRRTKPASPREIGEEAKRLLAERQVRGNLRRFAEAGATVRYIMADVQNAVALAAGLAEVRRTFGPVSAIIHGAGVLADRKIEELTDEQFLMVYSTKVMGLKNLLAACDEDPLKAIVLFSSSTGRFGRTGQVAYAAANEVLNKTAQQLKRSRPDCHTVAFNWGPWDGGMVTPGLAKLFHQEGIGLISLAGGGELMKNELRQALRPAEVVVIARPVTEEDSTEANKSPTPAGQELTLVFERTIRLEEHPVLLSHVINDKAVLPLALHAEWLAHAALHGNPGLRYFGFNELRVFQPVTVESAVPAQIQVFAGPAIKRGDLFAVPVEIRGRRNDRPVTFSRAEIVLVATLPAAEPAAAPPELSANAPTPEAGYELVLFHGPELRAIERIDSLSNDGVIAFSRTAPEPGVWMTHPPRGQWIGDPLATDAAFQMMILWTNHRAQKGSLPCFVGSYRQYRRAFPGEGVRIALKITRESGSTVRADIDMLDADGKLVARMRDAEHVMDAALNEAFRKGRQSQVSGPKITSRIGG